MDWFLISLFSIFFTAAKTVTNQHMKLSGMSLNIWRCLFAGLLFLPALPFMYWPDVWLFYFLTFIDGLISAYALMILLDLAAKQSARASSMYMPVMAISIFFGWYILHPETLSRFIEYPMQSWGALACILLTAIGINIIRDNDVEWKNFLLVAPIGLVFGLFSLVNRWLFDTYDIPPLEGSLTFTFLSFLIAVPLLLPYFAFRQGLGWQKAFMDHTLIKGGLITGILSGLAYFGYVWAVMTAPNPAFPGVIAMTLPAILYIYNRLRKVPEHVNLLGLILLLIGAGGLRLFSG